MMELEAGYEFVNYSPGGGMSGVPGVVSAAVSEAVRRRSSGQRQFAVDERGNVTVTTASSSPVGSAESGSPRPVYTAFSYGPSPGPGASECYPVTTTTTTTRRRVSAEGSPPPLPPRPTEEEREREREREWERERGSMGTSPKAGHGVAEQHYQQVRKESPVSSSPILGEEVSATGTATIPGSFIH